MQPQKIMHIVPIRPIPLRSIPIRFSPPVDLESGKAEEDESPLFLQNKFKDQDCHDESQEDQYCSQKSESEKIDKISSPLPEFKSIFKPIIPVAFFCQKQTNPLTITEVSKGSSVLKRKQIKPRIAIYAKNLTCYIVRCAIRQILNQDTPYLALIQRLCWRYGISHSELISELQTGMTRWTGIGKIYALVEEMGAISKIFSLFLGWFLRDRYLLHVLEGGKMKDARAYAKCKNELLARLKVRERQEQDEQGLIQEWFMQKDSIIEDIQLKAPSKTVSE